MKTYAEKIWGDCSAAVAYRLNFVQLCYTSEGYISFFKPQCQYCGGNEIQFRDLEYPKSGFSKKDYFLLDFYYPGVSEELKNDMIKFGVDESVFRPIFNKSHSLVLGYQIVPKKRLPEIYHLNSQEKKEFCDKCGSYYCEYTEDCMPVEVYNRIGYPIYISQEAYEQLECIQSTAEDIRDVIISLDLYNHLIKKYPRLECRPVFIGSIFDDPEYKRVHSK